MDILKKSILSTILYYDTLNRPLTSFEVFKYLVNPLHIASFYYFRNEFQNDSIKVSEIYSNRDKEIDFDKISLVSVRKKLQSKELNKFIKEKNGFYFLRGREDIIRTRIDRQKIADQKWKKAKKNIRWLQIIPYVRMVAVSGSLAFNNTREESDIDVLITVKAGRIWLTRFFVTVFLQIIGRRRHNNITKNRICLNHYIIDKSLEIKFRSLYNAQTYAHIIPVLEINKGIYKEFQEQNRWVKNYLAFWPSLAKVPGDELSLAKKEIWQSMHFKTLKINSFLLGFAKIGEVILNNKLGNILEKLSEKIQRKSIETDPLTTKKGGRITIDNTQLEFHPNSPERRVLDKYNQKMKKLGLEELAKEKDSGLL